MSSWNTKDLTTAHVPVPTPISVRPDTPIMYEPGIAPWFHVRWMPIAASDASPIEIQRFAVSDVACKKGNQDDDFAHWIAATMIPLIVTCVTTGVTVGSIM